MVTPARKKITTSEVFATQTARNATVTIRIMRMSDQYIYDWDDDTFKANLAACTTGSGPTTQSQDMGDATNSQYLATIDYTKLNTTSLQMQFMVQFRTATILETTEIWVAASRRVNIPYLPW